MLLSLEEDQTLKQLWVPRLGKAAQGARIEAPTLDCRTQALAQRASRELVWSQDLSLQIILRGQFWDSLDPLWLITKTFDFNPFFLH